MTGHRQGDKIMTMTMTMKRIAAALLLCAVAAPAWAGFEEGTAAHRKGDYAAALGQWQPLADQGDPRAQYALGYLNQFGQGLPQNLAKAVEWYQKSAAQNYPDAQYTLALLKQQGQAVPQDLPGAAELYRKAAESGESPEAEYSYARALQRAEGVARDHKKAFEWYKHAAAAGHPAAQYMLASYYEVGGPVPPDKVQAYVWYSRAGQAGEDKLRVYDESFNAKLALDTLKKSLTPQQLKKAQALAQAGGKKKG